MQESHKSVIGLYFISLESTGLASAELSKSRWLLELKPSTLESFRALLRLSADLAQSFSLLRAQRKQHIAILSAHGTSFHPYVEALAIALL